jgi:hypothetical protein
MRDNTPPTSPYHEDDDDDELIYVGDNIDDVIEQLEGEILEDDEENLEGK